MKSRLVSAALVIVAGLAAAPLHFSVASIKPDSPDNAFTSELKTELSGGRLHARQVLLREFIEEAYEIKPFQLLNASRWINTQGYTIEATAEGPVSHQECC
jgi:uncharacterized protein (TIGR03435 family)